MRLSPQMLLSKVTEQLGLKGHAQGPGSDPPRRGGLGARAEEPPYDRGRPAGVPGENMSGLKRMSKEVLLTEPTALQALSTTSRLLGSAANEGGFIITNKDVHTKQQFMVSIAERYQTADSILDNGRDQ